MTKQNVNGLDMDHELQFETEIKPLVLEKFQCREDAIQRMEQEIELLLHESTTAEFELMTVSDNAVKQRKISASAFDTEYKSKESKKMMEKHEQLEQ